MRGDALRLIISASLLILVLLILTSCAGAPVPEKRPEPVARSSADEVKSEPAAAGKQPEQEPQKENRTDEKAPTRDSTGSLKGVGEAGNNAVKGDVVKVKMNVDDVLELQKKKARENPFDVNEQLKLATLHALNGDLPQSEFILSNIRHRGHKLIGHLEAYVYGELGMHDKVGEILRGMLRTHGLREGFKIAQLKLCTQVSGFRRYKLNTSGQILPGGVALIYVEPSNFELKEEQEGFRLHLSYEWKLYDDRGKHIRVPLWEKASATDRQDNVLYAGRVQEFYQSFRLPLPDNLSAGDYLIEVTVTDMNGGNQKHAQYVRFLVPAVHR